MAERRRLGRAVTVLLGLAVWWLAGSLRVGGRTIFATPWQSLIALPRVAPQLAHDLLGTTARALLGLAIGTVAGLAVGLLAATFSRYAPSLEGCLDFARSIPPVILLPPFLLAFGYNDVARIATVAAGCAWIMALSVTAAASEPPSARREMLTLAGAGRVQVLTWTQPWESLPVLAVGLRNSASTAVVVATVTEMLIGADHGIGSRVVDAQIGDDTVALTLAILAIGVIGYVANVGLRWLELRARLMQSRSR